MEIAELRLFGLLSAYYMLCLERTNIFKVGVYHDANQLTVHIYLRCQHLPESYF